MDGTYHDDELDNDDGDDGGNDDDEHDDDDEGDDDCGLFFCRPLCAHEARRPARPGHPRRAPLYQTLCAGKAWRSCVRGRSADHIACRPSGCVEYIQM